MPSCDESMYEWKWFVVSTTAYSSRLLPVLLVVQVLDVVVVMLALDVLVGLCRQEKSSACALSRC
jgi:hypothetical protein